MTQLLQNRDRRSVRSDGRPTGIVVEDAIWDQLKLIAIERGVTISKLIGAIERTYRLEPPDPRQAQGTQPFIRCAHFRPRAHEPRRRRRDRKGTGHSCEHTN